MFKLALALVLVSTTVGCVESVNGKEPTSAPPGVSQAIPGDPPSVVTHREARTPAVADREPRAILVHHHEVVECWQCRR